MQMLKNVFKSKNKYYLELDESQPVKAVTKTAEKVNNAVKETTTEVLESEPVEKVVEAATKAKDAVQDTVENLTTTESKTEAKPEASKKTSKKASKKDAPEKSQKSPQLSPKNAGASSFEPPFWVAAMYKKNSGGINSDGTRAEQTFATDNLMPTISKYRRRPGPSLNKFKDMASKTRSRRG